MTNLDESTDQLVAELARRLRTPEPLMRTRVGLPNRTATTRAEPDRGTTSDGWSRGVADS